jgi:hypothetical protein
MSPFIAEAVIAAPSRNLHLTSYGRQMTDVRRRRGDYKPNSAQATTFGPEPYATSRRRAPSLAASPGESLTEKVETAMSESLPRSSDATVRCERDSLLLWLEEVLAASDGVDVHIVVEDAADARSSVQITLRDVRGPLAGLQLRRPA